MTELTHATATPFQKAGYTKDTKFKVITGCGGLREGDIVRLKYDDGGNAPQFINEATNGLSFMWLPGMNRDTTGILEVFEEKAIKETTPTPPTITHNMTVKGYTHVLTTEELVGVWSITNRIIVGD